MNKKLLFSALNPWFNSDNHFFLKNIFGGAPDALPNATLVIFFVWLMALSHCFESKIFLRDDISCNCCDIGAREILPILMNSMVASPRSVYFTQDYSVCSCSNANPCQLLGNFHCDCGPYFNHYGCV